MLKIIRLAGILTVSVIVLGVVPQTRAAPSFYQGKTLTIIVPFGPGGGYDRWARLIAPELSKQLRLKKVDVVNRPGAGGIIATNTIYRARPDGLTIAEIPGPGCLFSQIQHAPGVKFDLRKFQWLGDPANDPAVVAVRADSKLHSFSDVLQRKREGKPITALATGVGATYYNTGVLLLRAFDIPFHMVAAFKGSHQLEAVFVGGQGDILPMSVTAIRRLGNRLRIILQITDKRVSDIHAPTVFEMADEAGLANSQRAVLHGLAQSMVMQDAWVAPPGTPKGRLAALRSALRKSVSTAAFRANARKAGLRPNYVSPQALAAAAKAGFEQAGTFSRLLSEPAGR